MKKIAAILLCFCCAMGSASALAAPPSLNMHLVEPLADAAQSRARFRLLLINDTQHYGGDRGVMLEAMADWAVAEAEGSGNILCAIHTGDALASGYDEESAASLGRIAQALPLLLCAGNHDVGASAADYDGFLSLFPHLGEDFPQENLRDGGRALYYTFTAGGVKFMVIGVGWIVRKSDVAWLNAQLSAHSDHYAILFTHSYLRTSGGRTSTGERLFTQVVEANPNVRLVLCGHKHDCRVELADIDDGGSTPRRVYEMISNYQDVGDGGDGYLRLLTFDTARNTIAVEAYSPYLDDHNAFDDSRDEFVLETDFSFARVQ